MKTSDIDIIAEALGPVFSDIKRFVESQTQPLKKEIADLRERQSKAMVYRGIYSRSQDYEKNDVVTKSGAIWLCCKDNPSDGPGTPDWQLIAKSGN